MNWYNKAKHKGIIKTATMKDISETQDGQSTNFFDVQRYKMDSYSIRVGISQTGKKIGVSLLISHGFLGSIGWDAYWIYDLDEMGEARKMFNKINEITGETVDEFVENETPTSIFWPTLRSKVEMLDIDHMTSTNIPHINYAKTIAIEPDWRSNIYGTRYPKYDESNYGNWSRKMKEIWPKNGD